MANKSLTRTTARSAAKIRSASQSSDIVNLHGLWPTLARGIEQIASVKTPLQGAILALFFGAGTTIGVAASGGPTVRIWAITGIAFVWVLSALNSAADPPKFRLASLACTLATILAAMVVAVLLALSIPRFDFDRDVFGQAHFGRIEGVLSSKSLQSRNEDLRSIMRRGGDGIVAYAYDKEVQSLSTTSFARLVALARIDLQVRALATSDNPSREQRSAIEKGCTNAANVAACNAGSAFDCLRSLASGCTHTNKTPASTQDAGCQHVNNAAACTDNNAPTLVEVSAREDCQIASDCVSTPNMLPCDDGNPCTVGDACAGGDCVPANGCVHGNNTLPYMDSNTCTAGDACLDGVCLPGAGCLHANNTSSYPDGHACRVGDACGNCGSQSATCGDGNGPNANCDYGTGCTHIKMCTHVNNRVQSMSEKNDTAGVCGNCMK